MTSAQSERPGERGILERFLGLFADVKAGEAATALLLAFNVFILLSAYYILKVVREPLILAGGGAEVKSYASAGQAVLLVGGVYAYSALTKRFGRLKLLTILNLFFAGNLVLFWALAQWHSPCPPGVPATQCDPAVGMMRLPLGIPFFLWVGCFNLMAPAQFWSFANDVYTEDEGKRLFAIVGVGSSVGAWFGSLIAKPLIKLLDPYALMLIAAALLLASLGITWIVHHREIARRDGEAAKDGSKKGSDAPPGRLDGFRLLLKDRYLLLIAAMILFLNWVNTTGEYILDRTLVEEVGRKIAAGLPDGMTTEEFGNKFIGAFKADFFQWVNLVGIFVQLFVVSRVFKYFGLRVALFVLPLIALGSYTTLAFLPLLGVVRITKTAENSTDYSLHNTARQAVWLPTSREAKYNAKAAVDTFIVRAGDLLSAGVVAVGSYLAFNTKHFALVNVGLVLGWLVITAALARKNAELSHEPERTTEKAVASTP